MTQFASLGVDGVILAPAHDAPAAWISTVGAPLVARLTDTSGRRTS